MKKSELQLLNHLQEGEVENSPLSNIMQGLGELKNIKGNPLFSSEITFNVSLNFFANLTPITTALLPVNLRLPIPVFLLGLTDFYSGYSKALQYIQPQNPWQPSNRIGYSVGSEMATNFFQAAFWNFTGANWVFGFPFLRSNGIVPPDGRLRKFNFWQIGHRYLISFRVDNTLNDFANMLFEFNDGAFVNSVVNHDYIEVSYEYIPTTTELTTNAINGFQCDIHDLSIREITGEYSYISDPPVGILGYNKNTVLSQNAVRGDLVATYSAFSYPNPNLYTAEVVVHCNSVSYGTFLNSFVSDLITVETLRYSVPIANINQFINPLSFIYQTLFGKTFNNDIDPRMYITNTDFQQQICDIPIKFPIDKNLLIGTYINFDCPSFDLTLFVKKVEALTLRKKYLNR